VNNHLLQVSARFEDWIRQHALPLWAHDGFDPSTHVFYERLLPDGSADCQANIRVRVQARQIFVYAMAHHLGWYSDGRSIAEKNIAFVDSHAAHPIAGQGYAHLLDSHFKIIDGRQDLYDHSFFVLAYAWCYRSFGMEAALEKAVALIEYFDRVFYSKHGGWIEGDYPAEYRRQNPHMHLLEAFLALYDATREERWLAKAGEMVRLFETRFYDRDQQVLLEYFNDDWSVLAADKGEILEPGHMMEWVWLLRWYEDRTGRLVSHFADALFDKALEIGLSRDSGLLYDEVKADGSVIKPTKRCWPVIEYIKASIAQARAGRAEGEEHAAIAIDRLFQYYICNERIPGLYIDRRGADDGIVDDVTPASTLYHLIVAAAEASAYCSEKTSDPQMAADKRR
jgi:mannose-6-phosphate isomerase